MSFKTVDHFNIDLDNLLGQGSFARVYKAYDMRDRSIEAAVKMISAIKLQKSRDEMNLFMREIDVLRQIKGEHVAQLLDVKTTVNNLYIFTEFCNGGTLKSLLAKKKVFSEEEACSIVKQIATAFVNLSMISRNGQKITVMHRDIKPDNILFHKGKVKVADFGFAKTVSEIDQNIKKAHTICGTPLYESPQVIAGQNYSAKCDVWSTGVLFYEILFGHLPWAKCSLIKLEETIKIRPLTFSKGVSAEVKDLVNKMLMVREEDRISWLEVYSHPALNRDRELISSPPKMMSKFCCEAPIEITKEQPENSPPKKPVVIVINQETEVRPELEKTPKKTDVPARKENMLPSTPMKRDTTPTKKIFGDEFKQKRALFPEPIKFEMVEPKNRPRQKDMPMIVFKIRHDKSPNPGTARRLV